VVLRVVVETITLYLWKLVTCNDHSTAGRKVNASKEVHSRSSNAPTTVQIIVLIPVIPKVNRYNNHLLILAVTVVATIGIKIVTQGNPSLLAGTIILSNNSIVCSLPNRMGLRRLLVPTGNTARNASKIYTIRALAHEGLG
jgi:hypothetical protein